MRTDYPNMFSPIEIRGKTCPNRTFFAPTHTGLGDPDSAVNDAVLAWMHVRAKGGASMIVSECILGSDRYGRQLARSLGIAHEVKKDGFRMGAV